MATVWIFVWYEGSSVDTYEDLTLEEAVRLFREEGERSSSTDAHLYLREDDGEAKLIGHFADGHYRDQRYETLPLFTVLRPKEYADWRDFDARGAFNAAGNWVGPQDWGVFMIDGDPGTDFYDKKVYNEAKRQGINIACDGSWTRPLILDHITDSGTERYAEDCVPDALAAGLTLVKLPDRKTSASYRWYVVDETVLEKLAHSEEVR